MCVGPEQSEPDCDDPCVPRGVFFRPGRDGCRMSTSDVQAIRRLKHEYCFLIDEGHYEEWADLFTEDGQFTSSQGGTYENPDEIEAFAASDFDAAFDETAHIVTNPVIDVDGDEATGRWYLVLCYRTNEGETGWIQTSYEDVYRKVDGEWKIASSVSRAGIEN